MAKDPLARGLAATILVVFILGVILRAFGLVGTPAQAGGITLAAASYLFGGWVGRNGHA